MSCPLVTNSFTHKFTLLLTFFCYPHIIQNKGYTTTLLNNISMLNMFTFDVCFCQSVTDIAFFTFCLIPQDINIYLQHAKMTTIFMISTPKP